MKYVGLYASGDNTGTLDELNTTDPKKEIILPRKGIKWASGFVNNLSLF